MDTGSPQGMEDGEVDDSLCVSCNQNRFKYRCPHCNSGKTCSLACSVAHKKACQRTNHPTKFVSIHEFDITQLGKGIAHLFFLTLDQSFLASVERTVESASKLNEGTAKNNKFNWIKCAARKGIQVVSLPSHFSEHKSNKTKRLPNDSLEWMIAISTEERDFLLEKVPE